MEKVLFFTESDKQRLTGEINNELKIKNRLLKVLWENANHKLTDSDRNKLANRYQDQIAILESIKSVIPTVKSRDDIQKVNSMIDYFNSIE